MFPALPLARSGYTLHIFVMAERGIRPARVIARLMCPSGRVSHEWATATYRWWLPSKVASLRCSIDGLVDPDEQIPVYYAEIRPPDRGLRQPTAMPQLAWGAIG